MHEFHLRFGVGLSPPSYLTQKFWGGEMDLYLILECIYAKVNVTTTTEIRKPLANFTFRVANIQHIL